MASQPPLEPASAPPPSSLASFLESHDTWLTGGGTHLRRIVPERLESKYACTVNSLRLAHCDACDICARADAVAQNRRYEIDLYRKCAFNMKLYIQM